MRSCRRLRRRGTPSARGARARGGKDVPGGGEGSRTRQDGLRGSGCGTSEALCARLRGTAPALTGRRLRATHRSITKCCISRVCARAISYVEQRPRRALSDGAQPVSQLDPRPGCKSPEASFRPACPIARELSAREECEAAPECEPCSLLVAVVASCARYSYSRGASLVRCPARRLFVVPRGYTRGRTWDWGSDRHLRVINPQTCY